MLTASQLTLGERLRIFRRRYLRTQAEQARVMKVPLGTYKRMEADEIEADRMPIGRVEPHEACMIMRRRKGMTLEQLGEEIGLTKWWICQMETGQAPTTTLVAYWSNAQS